MKPYRRSRDIAPSILKLDTRWRLVVHVRLWPLYLWGLGPKFLLNRRLRGLQSHSGGFGDEENILLLLETEPLRASSLYLSSYTDFIRHLLPELNVSAFKRQVTCSRKTEFLYYFRPFAEQCVKTIFRKYLLTKTQIATVLSYRQIYGYCDRYNW
jgi:hypothetical protein